MLNIHTAFSRAGNSPPQDANCYIDDWFWLYLHYIVVLPLKLSQTYNTKP